MAGLMADWFAGFEAWLDGPLILGVTAGRWGALIVFAIVGWLLGLLAGWQIRAMLRRVRQQVKSIVWADDVEHRLTSPVSLLVSAVAARIGMETLRFPEHAIGNVRSACNIVLILVTTLLSIRLIGVGKQYLQAILVGHAKDAGRVRSITTRVSVPARILQVLLGAVGAALALLQFHAVQEVGVSLLASAGVAGIVLGFAAQRTIGNLMAGLQLAFAEPIRIGDSVVVEGEFGEVEEINLTHVIVKVWDLHRLVLPVVYFVEQPFQNWTRGSSRVLGSVMLRADFSVPVQHIRDELHRVLSASKLWDGKTANLQVTELSGDQVEMRALVSAEDSDRLWDLRCHVREELLTWLQSHGGKHLPVQRVEAVGDNARKNGPLPRLST
jgi:small-conductance mechanosensitive channel